MERYLQQQRPRYHDYDRPQDPRSSREGSRDQPNGDDFHIKGRAVKSRSRSPLGRERNEAGPRRRDGRFHDRSYRHRDQRWTARDDYDETVHEQHIQQAPLQYRGDDDVGSDSQPVKFLLIRGLKPATTEAVFAKGLKKLYAADEMSIGARAGSLRSVMLIRDRQCGDTKSLGFGYAWYHDVADASAALRRARELGDNFTISSQNISVDMPQKGVFPRTDFSGDDTETRFTFVMPETGERHEYKDPRYYPTEMLVNANRPVGSRDVDTGSSEEKPKLTVNSTKKVKKHPLDSELQGGAPKRINMTPAMAALANRWSSRRTDLHVDEDVEANVANSSTGVNAIVTADKTALVEAPRVQTFAYDNPPKSCCYLCNRLLGDSAKLKAHVEKSQLHATSLQNEVTVKEAYQRMERAGVAQDATLALPVALHPPSPPPSDHALPQYVDRAALRRLEEKTRAPATTYDKPKGFSLKAATSSSKVDDISLAPSLSKGLGMLQKHGYKAGEGLGAAGSTGLAAPISTDLYAAGVGLGHVGGKVGDAVTEAARATKGDQAGYLDKMKEVSRARYDEALKKGQQSGA